MSIDTISITKRATGFYILTKLAVVKYQTRLLISQSLPRSNIIKEDLLEILLVSYSTQK